MGKANSLSWLKLSQELQIHDSDAPDNIHIIRRIIKHKPFLINTYKSFYQDILSRIKTVPQDGELIELGSGASFLKAELPPLVTSDVLPYEGVDKVFSALDIPLSDNSVSAFIMTDVLHHIKDSRQFFREMNRCLKIGGKVVMIEPANTLWSSFIYSNFHPEPFDEKGGWGFEDGGPLTGANGAIPWIVFSRDVETFKQEFPELRVRSVRLHTPFKYLLSGGLSFRQLLPSWCYPVVTFIEWIVSPLNRYLAMFMTIELEKRH